jgi:hypothetical protein
MKGEGNVWWKPEKVKPKTGGVDAYHFCPLRGKECLENRCGWWLDIDGFGGCAIRCLGALLEIAGITTKTDKR